MNRCHSIQRWTKQHRKSKFNNNSKSTRSIKKWLKLLKKRAKKRHRRHLPECQKIHHHLPDTEKCATAGTYRRHLPPPPMDLQAAFISTCQNQSLFERGDLAINLHWRPTWWLLTNVAHVFNACHCIIYENKSQINKAFLNKCA